MAIDMAQFPAHVQEAIRLIDLPASALRRAKNGVAWLDKRAPDDWRLQMISIYGGKVTSHVRLCRDNENPLALAFRRLKTFQRSDGRVTWAEICHLVNNHEAVECGFKETEWLVPNHVLINEDIDGQFLDEAWAQVLSDYCGLGQPAPYQWQIEKAFMLWSAVRSFAKAS